VGTPGASRSRNRRIGTTIGGALLSVAVLVAAGLRNVASRWREGFWSGLAVLRSLHGRNGVIALVLVAVFVRSRAAG
jgi:hypothetical protein